MMRLGWLCSSAPVLILLIELASVLSNAQEKSISLRELSQHRANFDAKTVRVKGTFQASHIGPLLKDESGEVAARLRFEDPPRPALKGPVVKDELYRRLYDTANNIRDPDMPKVTYEVELICVVKILKTARYDIYKDSPIELYPVHVVRFAASAAHRDEPLKRER